MEDDDSDDEQSHRDSPVFSSPKALPVPIARLKDESLDSYKVCGTFRMFTVPSCVVQASQESAKSVTFRRAPDSIIPRSEPSANSSRSSSPAPPAAKSGNAETAVASIAPSEPVVSLEPDGTAAQAVVITTPRKVRISLHLL